MKCILLSILLLQTGLLMPQTGRSLPQTTEDDWSTTSKRFFRTDTAYLQVHMKGYTSEPGMESGMIFLRNEIIGESAPTVVNIHPDGRFSCKFVINHPIENRIHLNDEVIPFYIEPGETLNLFIARNTISTTNPVSYTGASATLNQLLNSANKLLDYNGGELLNACKTTSPAQFAEQLQPLFRLWEQRIDSLIAINGSSEKATHLLRNKLSIKKGVILLDFLSARNLYATRDSTNSILQIREDNSYYEFLKEMPLDDETALSSREFGTFINRFEYMSPLRKGNETAIINRLCGTPNPLVWQIAGIRRLNNILKFVDNKDKVLDYLTTLKQSLHHPFFLSEAERIFNERQLAKENSSYELPAGRSADVFHNIIRPHQDKVLFVDFWATSCGGCRLGIEQTAELRKKYKNHPEFQFIFITSERASPIGSYTKYIEKNLPGEISYRISETEFNHLMELFHFSGIPHYELIEKGGSVSTKNLSTFNLAPYLEKRFGKNE